MSQADYIVSNGTGAAVRSDLNNQLAAIVSNNSGSTGPATMYAYQWWADTTTGLLKLRNGANNAWITIGTLGSANLGLLSLAGGTMTGALAAAAGTAALPGIAFTGDLDTGISAATANTIVLSTNATARQTISTTAISAALPVDVPLGAAATPSLTFTGDLNTGIFSSGADAIDITTGGTRRLGISSAGDLTAYGGNLTLNTQGDLRFADSDSSHYIAIQAPSTVASNVTFSLPSADGTSGQALVTNGSGGLSFASLTGTRNRIINGNMRIDQRNAGTSVNTTSAFPVDRFRQVFTSPAVITSQQSTTAPAGFTNSLQATVTTADASLTSIDENMLIHQIEGFNAADFDFGTANAKTITISFWVRSSLTGSFGFALKNSAINRSYPTSYTISAANTWEFETITIAGDTTGTWLKDNGKGLECHWSLGAASGLKTTGNAWASGNYNSATGTVNWISTSGATFFLTGVQVELGSVATPFERRSYGQELALCQRYFQQGQFQTGGTATSGIGFYGQIFYQSEYRANPTLLFSSVGAVGDFDTAVPTVATVNNTKQVSFFKAATATGSGIYSFTWTGNAELS